MGKNLNNLPEGIRGITTDLKETDFLFNFIEEFIHRDLGRLPGRETLIAIIRLLLESHPTWKANPPSDYELARLFRISNRKLRNIRDEISYRDNKHDDEWCKVQLKICLEKAEKISDGGFVIFQINDALVRDYAQRLVQTNYGFFEQGFRSDVIKLSGNTFAALTISLLPEATKNKLLQSINVKKSNDNPLGKTIIRLFLENFAESAGSEAGKLTVRLGFSILSGGLSEISNALSIVKSLPK